jgi:hypothetical protein
MTVVILLPKVIMITGYILPLWEDCRKILKSLNIAWNRAENRLNENSAFENDRERLILRSIC